MTAQVTLTARGDRRGPAVPAGADAEIGNPMPAIPVASAVRVHRAR
ncbi:hypothetical protein [Mycolicibacterium sp. XJ1904]